MRERPARVAVVGAGVSGLTCGAVLAESGFDVTLFASEIHKTTSAVPAAIWYPYHAQPREKVERWGHASYRELAVLADDPRSGVSLVEFRLVSQKRRRPPKWSREMKPRYLDAAEAHPFPYGFAIEVPLMETPIYLPWLRHRFRRAGGRIRRRTITDLHDLERDFAAVVNCSGRGARKLCNEDGRRFRPGRGIVVKTTNPGGLRTMLSLDKPLTYIVPRRSDVILGGTDDRSEDLNVPPEIAMAIYARCKAIEPRLPDFFEPDAGIRPLRSEVRLERERGSRIIHNYGHGGAGFTLSWGCARDVLRLVKKAV
jgi:D-amino-acid oxidase